MTGPENYRRAELLLAQARDDGYGERNADLLAAAQAHAALAQAAATALGSGDLGVHDYEAWRAVAGTNAASGAATPETAETNPNPTA